MIAGLDPATMAAFLGVALVLNITPGADAMFATASGLSGGPRAGVAAAAGVVVGASVYILLAAAGGAAVLAASPMAFDLMRWAGAGYLAFLAVKSWRATAPENGQGQTRLGRAFGRGVLTNLLNPKTTLFIFALLPQFTRPETGDIALQILVLGGIFLTSGFLVTALYGVGAGAISGALRRHARLLNRVSAGVYGLLALRLLWGTAKG